MTTTVVFATTTYETSPKFTKGRFGWYAIERTLYPEGNTASSRTVAGGSADTMADAERAARIAVAHLEAEQALKTNRCPRCGAGVRRNLALTGWVQCEQFGAPQFRKSAAAPACDWQGFTR